MIANKAVMVDASFTEVPRQRNSREENKEIKEGSVPEDWQKEENKAKLNQKDTDTRWTKKNGQNYYGCKNHVKEDSKSKIIKSYTVTSANVHDSQELEGLLDSRDAGQPVYADSAYRRDEIEKVLKKKNLKSRIHEKGYRSHPLTKPQQKTNTTKSRTRVRVEHVFGFMENTMKITRLRTRGKPRIERGHWLDESHIQYMPLCTAGKIIW